MLDHLLVLVFNYHRETIANPFRLVGQVVPEGLDGIPFTSPAVSVPGTELSLAAIMRHASIFSTTV